MPKLAGAVLTPGCTSPRARRAGVARAIGRPSERKFTALVYPFTFFASLLLGHRVPAGPLSLPFALCFFPLRAHFLDRRAGSPGYTVFGKVIEGTDVVDKIKAVKTEKKKFTVPDPRDPTKTIETTFPNVPVDNVVVKSIRRAESK